MGSHPLNLALRFILECIALFIYGFWGWQTFDGLLGLFITIGFPLFIAILWGTFAVPEDPSRSAKAPVKIRGIFRLVLELGIFELAVILGINLGYESYSWIFASIVLLHYILSYDRVLWLIKH